MAASDPQRIVEEHLESYTQRDTDQLESRWADDIQSEGDLLDRDECLSAIEAYWEAFPDRVIHEQRAIASGEFGAVRITFSGTRTGEYSVFEQTGEGFETIGMMFPVSNVQIEGYWYAWDGLGLQEELVSSNPPLYRVVQSARSKFPIIETEHGLDLEWYGTVGPSSVHEFNLPIYLL